uniref:Peroxisomal sarcosine oxidase n=1 Tax=Varanus komodoensis TaxID=61221 RepID=A0A8D2LPB1_VARKO
GLLSGSPYDAIVVGAGIQGSFTALHLARRGQRTLLLEQFRLPHTQGSSHGESRIIRTAYPQDYYTAMMAEAFPLWAQLEAAAGTRLYRPAPLLVLGRPEDPQFRGYRSTMERHHVPGEVLCPEALAQRFPGLCPHGGEMAVCDRTAGVLHANRALRAVQDQFRRLRGTLRDGEEVLRIQPGAVVTVATGRGEYRARRLVLAAGPWTNRLLAPLGRTLPLQPLRISVCYWRAKDPGARSLVEQLPAFIGIHLGGGKRDIFGLPAGEHPGLVKICYHHGSRVDPDDPGQLDRSATPVPDIPILQDFLRKYLPGLDPEPALQECCLYTNTPDGDFVLDRHPRFQNIAIGAGFSGHGFKLAPVVGKILSELSLGEEPSYNLAPFRISRFPTSPKASL